MADYLTDDQFLGGSAAGAAPAQPAQPAQSKYLTDEQFLGGAPTGKYLTDDQFLRGQQAAPRHESRGPLGEFWNSLYGTLVKDNPKLVGGALEGLAELYESPTTLKLNKPTEAGGTGFFTKEPTDPATNPLRKAAAALQEYGKKGEAERQPAVNLFSDIRTNEGLGTAVKDALDYAAAGFGQMAGSSAPSLAAGFGTAAITENPVAGFVAGAFGPSFLQNFGDTYIELRDNKDVQAAIAAGKLTKKDMAKIAAEYSVPMAFGDTLQAEKVFGPAVKELKGYLMKRMVKRALIGMATEAPTESGQQVLQEFALQQAGGQRSFADQVKNVFDAFLKGAIGGFGLSAFHPGPRAPDEVTPQPDTTDTTTPPPPGAVPPGAAPAGDVLGQEEPTPGYIRTSDLPPPEGPPPGQAEIKVPPTPEAPASVLDSRIEQPFPLAPARTDAEVRAEIERRKVPDSPRLTEEDRASPIPNEIIDEGKKAVEQATGKPSTITTAQEVNGHVQVTDTNVSDLTAQLRANTQALIDLITRGVSVPQISQETGQPAPPASAEPLAGVPVPEAALAPVGAPVAAPANVAPDVLPEARFQASEPDELTRRFGPPGTQARTLEEARLAKGSAPIVLPQPGGGTIEITHPYYETFEARIDGKKVGELNVSPQGPHASSVRVEPQAQRQGVATALYDAAEAALGRPMTPSPMGMSGDAIGFWKNRFAGMEPEQKQAILQQALDKGIEQKIPKSARERVDALGYLEPAAAIPRQPEETDKEFAKRVIDKRPQPKELPETYPDYFIMKGAKVVPIGDLVSSKTDEENKQGGGNAVKRMAAAAKGELAKRAPITVKQMPDGKYLITDGNGTYTSVKDYGWKAMPVLVESGEAPQTKPAPQGATEKGKEAVSGAETPAKAAAAPAASAATAEPAAQKALKEKITEKRAEVEAATPAGMKPATEAQVDRFAHPPHKTFDEIYATAPDNKKQLDAVIDDIAKEFGLKAKKADLKERAKAEKKVAIKGYQSPAHVTDIIRGGFLLSNPDQMEPIVQRLRQHFGVLDEGWKKTPAGYVDGKALVRFDDGQVGEIQFWEPNILDAKEKGDDQSPDTGHNMYEEERVLEFTSPRAIELRRLMNELYSRALALAEPVWSNLGKGSKPQPRYLSRQSASDMRPPVYQTSWASTSTQSPSGRGLSSALASVSPSTAGLKSQSMNLTETPPSSGVVLRNEPGVKSEEPKFQARTIREGTETPESLGLPQRTEKGKPIRHNTRQIAAALEARQRERYGTIARDDRSPEAQDRISDWIVDEVDFESQPSRQQQSGAGWYSAKFQNALNRFGEVLFPELLDGKKMMSSDLPGLRRLKTKKNARNFLTAIIAVTSDGQLAAQNFENAAKLYNEFRHTGSFDIDKVTFGGDRNASIKTNLANILHMLQTYGPEEMHTTLMREEAVADLKKTAAESGAKFSTQYQAHIRMPLASLVFGPKLGAFYANLMGAHGYLTMDRWWSRTFNRYRGQILKRVTGLMNRPTDARGNKIGLARFKEMLGKPNLSDEEALVEALHHAKLYEEKGFKGGSDLEKTANTIRKDSIGTEDQPFNSTDRTFMIETTEMARQKLEARGVRTTLADIQAILWYFEKRLYSELGARKTPDVSYEEIANRITQRAPAGDRPTGPDASDAVEGPDGNRFSISQESRDQDVGRARAAVAAQFVSPNVAEGGGIAEALQGLEGERQSALQKASREIDDAFNIKGDRQDAIGAWSDGAENTTVMAFDSDVSWEALRVTAAMKGHLADQKAVLIFKQHDTGTSFLYRMHVPETDVQTLHANLIEDGVAFHTIVPQKSGSDVVVVDLDGSAHDAMAKAAERYNADVTTQQGQAEFIGTTKEDGTAREQRDDARRAYEEVIRQSPIQASQELWSGIHDRWGKALESTRFKKGAAEAPAAPKARTEVKQVQGGNVIFALSPQMVEKAEAVFKDLRKILDKLGLPNVDIKVWQQIFADMEHGAFGVDGMYLKNLIHIALEGGPTGRNNPDLIIHHEAIHALWDKLTPTEQAILTRKSKKEWITDKIKGIYPEHQWVEEGVAHAYTSWLEGERMDGVIAHTFKKIKTILKALYQAFTGHDIRTSDDIFRQVTSGSIGRRAQGKASLAGREGMFQIAWHGSAAKFFEFSKNFIGTGQGEARYGRGFYFARKADRQYAATFGKNVYEADIPDDDKMMIWDEKLSNQPKGVQANLGKIFDMLGKRPENNYDQKIYHWLSKELGNDQLASQTLHEFGIPGHVFERRGQEGAVVYEPESIKTLSVNGEQIDVAPRFNINTPPHNAQQSQQVMQGFIARGQLLDRAIRVPFSLLGGTKDGVFHWGKRLDEKMGAQGPQRREAAAIGGIVGAGIGTFVGGPGLGTAAGAVAGGSVGAYILGGQAWPTSGAFGFFRNFAENAKRGLISNYGLDPEYIETFRQSELYKDMKARDGAGHLKVLHNAGVGTAEAKVLQAILSGEPVNDADMIRLSLPIRQAIDDMGAEAVALGQISAESFERNRGSYLHRVYAKNEVDQSKLSGWVSAKMASRRKKIIGDQLKGRGMFWDLATDRLMQDAGAHPVPTKGDKWRVLDNTASTGKVMKRVYFPANKPIPMEFSGPSWVDRGEWEVRQIGSGKATLWRDYTKEERGKMGEITDARYTIAKTFMLMANDLGTGKFYHDIAAKAEWTQTAEPAAGTWKEGGEYNAMNGRYWEDPDIRWVKVPDTAIAKTGGKKTWGALAGKFVRAEIWRDINELHLANNPGTWRNIYRQWKANHTYRHPVVHMNNVMSNVLFMDMADVRVQDLVGGIKAYASGGKDYREALDNGAFGADTVSQELRDNVLKPILDEITKQQTGATNPFLAKTGIAGVIADKLWSWAKTADDGMMRAYRAEDEIFRMALYMRRRSLGASPRAAALEARDQFLNYDIRAPWVVAMRNTLLPFISYTYRAVPMIMHSIQLRPWKIAKYAAVAYAVNALAYMLDDWWDDDKDKKKDGETRERAALQDQEQGYTWIGTPRMVRMPWRDRNGLPVFLDVRRWIPAGDVFDTTQGSAALPMPGPLNFGGPLQLAFEYNLNRKAFSGDDITNDLTQTNAEKFTTVVDWAWKAWTPPSFWNPGSYYWAKIGNAMRGATDAAGHPYTVPQALLSSIGIKLKPVDVENGIMWHYFDFKQVQQALKKDLRAAARQLERGLISQSAFDSQAANILEKFETLGQNIDEFSKRAELPKKGQ